MSRKLEQDARHDITAPFHMHFQNRSGHMAFLELSTPIIHFPLKARLKVIILTYGCTIRINSAQSTFYSINICFLSQNQTSHIIDRIIRFEPFWMTYDLRYLYSQTRSFPAHTRTKFIFIYCHYAGFKS